MEGCGGGGCCEWFLEGWCDDTPRSQNRRTSAALTQRFRRVKASLEADRIKAMVKFNNGGGLWECGGGCRVVEAAANEMKPAS